MARQSVRVLGEEDRVELMKLGGDLDLVWNHPHCPVHLKKRILRTVIREIIVQQDENPSNILGHSGIGVGVRQQVEAAAVEVDGGDEVVFVAEAARGVLDPLDL